MSAPNDTSPISLRERLLGAALVAPIRAASHLPYRPRVAVAGWLTSWLLAPLAGYRARVRDNLAHACPELPRSEVRRLMTRVTDNAGRNMMELYSPEFINIGRAANVTGPGLSELRAARDAGRPAVLVTGHFGSFNAARLAMIAQGFDMGVFYRPMSNPSFNAHYVKAMGAISEPMFEQGRRGMMQMVKHLRGGGIIAILNDLNAQDGVPLDFFGKPALTSLATAEMALKFDAPLVPVWGLRTNGGRAFEIIVETPIAHSDPVTMTQEFNDRLERMVRAHMDQWFWIHRRWKDGTGPLAEKRAEYLRGLQDKG